MSDRKQDHIDLALKSQTVSQDNDRRFLYEPLLSAHPGSYPKFEFLGHTLSTPIWASSMTGGTKMARTINENIARVCKDYSMGMGLGSCRSILEDNTYFADFNMRPFIGNSPLFANLGVAQVQLLLDSGKTSTIQNLVDKLKANGLIIHVNPLQEYFQPEGNKITQSPLHTIEQLLENVNFPIIVKEVGQGMGPESLKSLLKLPLAAIEFGAYGGTNFSLLELMRAEPALYENFKPFINTGQTAAQMVDSVNKIVTSGLVKCKQVIISGGISNFLDGYYLMQKSSLPAVYGQASAILKHAKESYESLHQFIEMQIKGLTLAKAYLRLNPDNHD